MAARSAAPGSLDGGARVRSARGRSSAVSHRVDRLWVNERRVILQGGLGMSGALLLGCGNEAAIATERGAERDAGPQNAADAGLSCGDSLSGAELLLDAEYVADVPFVGESEIPLGVAFNQGLDGRLYTDLSLLEPERLEIDNENFYIRTRYPDQLVAEDPWTIRFSGLVDEERVVALSDLAPLVEEQGSFVLECSGNALGASFGLMSSARWGGVPLLEVLERVTPLSSATRVLVSGFDEHSAVSEHSTPGASWVFSFEQLEQTGAFLATTMNGEPLPPDHGAPVRLFVPGWYGCTCIKWVNEVVLVSEDEPATSQMREFASRTHQSGVPELARDYIAASMDTATMPIRVERWRRDGAANVYRVVGIVWGGQQPVNQLEIRFGGGDFERVSVCPRATQTRTWSWWEHVWRPTTGGIFPIVLRVPDAAVRTRRLDTAYYERSVEI